MCGNLVDNWCTREEAQMIAGQQAHQKSTSFLPDAMNAAGELMVSVSHFSGKTDAGYASRG